ncbi:MAG: hypothetical protein AB1758_33070, partial [Candidatus Eremiobacterota bacterium]
MKRWWEILLILAVAACLGALGARTARRPTVYDPQGPPLTFNHLKPGDTLAAAESRYGPPDFSNPSVRFQQWEDPLTQVHYDERRVLIRVEGSGRGIVRQGERVLFRCGQPEQDVARVFGSPLRIEGGFYVYPGFKLHLGSRQGPQRWVSGVVL